MLQGARGALVVSSVKISDVPSHCRDPKCPFHGKCGEPIIRGHPVKRGGDLYAHMIMFGQQVPKVGLGTFVDNGPSFMGDG